MMSPKMEKALNHQLVEEGYSSHLYLAMASWCEKNSLHGSARFMYHHAEEERAHMLKIFRYLNERNAYALVPEIKEPPHQFKSLTSVMEATLEHERHITKAIHHLVELSQSEKDHAAFSFLQWFVLEQVEEENVFETIMDMIRLAGTEGRGLYLIDKEIGKKTDADKK
ncbi:MAG: ferritin [Candidatus Omnitrophota bacterium]